MATLQDLRNTGVGIAEGSQDPLFSVTMPDTTVGYGYVGYEALYPFPDNTETSKFLFPTSTQAWGPPGTYQWKFVFEMTAQQAQVARVTGRFKCDDQGQCFFNDVAESSVVGLGVWGAFDVTSGFVQGTNTLRFSVLNDPSQPDPLKNSTGIEIQFTYIFSGTNNAMMFSCNT